MKYELSVVELLNSEGVAEWGVKSSLISFISSNWKLPQMSFQHVWKSVRFISNEKDWPLEEGISEYDSQFSFKSRQLPIIVEIRLNFDRWSLLIVLGHWPKPQLHLNLTRFIREIHGKSIERFQVANENVTTVLRGFSADVTRSDRLRPRIQASSLYPPRWTFDIIVSIFSFNLVWFLFFNSKWLNDCAGDIAYWPLRAW